MRTVKKALCLGILLSSLYVQAATISSVKNGSFTNADTWDCLCIPANTDDIIIDHTVNSWATKGVSSVTVNAGAEMIIRLGVLYINGTSDFATTSTVTIERNARLELRGDANLNGTIDGLGRMWWNAQNGVRNFDGVPNIIMRGVLEVRPGRYMLAAASTFNLSAPNIIMRTSAVVENHGRMTVDRIQGTGFSILENKSGAFLEFIGTSTSSVKVNASESGNTVTYRRNGAATQYIYRSNTGYDRLHLIGSSLTSLKALRDKITVKGELIIENCTFDVASFGLNSDIVIEGDWNNLSGEFVARDKAVEFAGSSVMFNHTGEEDFFDVSVSGELDLMSDMSVSDGVSITPTGDLATNGFGISVEGDWSNNGAFSPDGGSVRLEGSSITTISGYTDFGDLIVDKTGSTVSLATNTGVFGTLSLDNGTMQTNDNLIIRSDASGTGRIGEITGGTLVGEATVQRFLDFPIDGWRLIAAPRSGATIATWDDDFVMTGFTGSEWPLYYFNSVTTYDETQPGHKDIGMDGVSSINDAIANGQGVRAYIDSEDEMLTTTGAMNTGAFNWAVTYTDSGSPDDDGWNLVANPYASTIDWDDNANWTKTNVRDAVYTWVSEFGQFSSYVAGIGTNGGSSLIPSSQAFWIQTNGAAPSLAIDEGAKTAMEGVYRNDDVANSFFKLSLTDADGLSDELAVRVSDVATRDFDEDLDAHEFRSELASYPSIALRTTDDVLSSIYSLSLNGGEEVQIPLVIYTEDGGTVTIQEDGFRDVAGLSSMAIYDLRLGEIHQFRGGELSLELPKAGEVEFRYALVLRPSAELQVGATKDLSALQSSGSIFQPHVSGDILVIRTESPRNIDYRIWNHQGQLILAEQNVQINRIYRTPIRQVRGAFILEMVDNTTGEREAYQLVK